LLAGAVVLRHLPPRNTPQHLARTSRRLPDIDLRKPSSASPVTAIFCKFLQRVGPAAHDGRMDTTVDEIGPDIYRISTWIPDITEHGFTFNQFLLKGDEPFLFHCGQRQLFPLVSQAINRVIALEKLRWISFAHVEADECGAVNLLLDAAPNAEVIHGPLACMLSLNDMCDRPPVVVGDDPLDTGGHRLRFIPTPHVPHNWESGLWFDDATSTLLAGDLLTHAGKCPALTETDCVAPALEAEAFFHATSMTTNLGPTLAQLAALNPTTLALMHGASYSGDGATQLSRLADGYATMMGASLQ
jgi:flavorubredoxin